MSAQLLRMAECYQASAGPKAATLARMSKAGLPVPEFVVVPADAYRAHARRAGIRVGPTSRLSAERADILRGRIATTPLAPQLVPLVTAAVAELGLPLAVRSSGTAEDLPGLSFAGQYETYVCRSEGNVVTRIPDCWASVWGRRAFSYRERNGVPHHAAAMAVIVQRYIEAEQGGVAFTADPVTGGKRVIVESSADGAEALVSGTVAPMRREFDPEAVSGEEGLEADVARLALSAEQVLGAPADIEWAWDGRRLWLLQARPITTGVFAAKPRYRATGWSNVNTGEVLPDVVTPMTWSLVGRLAVGLIDALFGKLGIRIDNDRLVSLIGGRAYFNASLLSSAFLQMPFKGDSEITSIFGGGDAPEGFTDLPLAPEDTAHLSKVRLVFGLPLVGIWMLQHTAGASDRWCARMGAGTGRALAELAAAATEEEIAAVTSRIAVMLEGLVDALAYMGVGMARYSAFVDAAGKHFGEDGPALVNTLLAGQGGVASAESGLALARMARTARANTSLAEALRSSARWDEVRERLQALGPQSDALLEAWDAFMAEHGHHARGELEFSAPRWAELPDEVLAMLTAVLGTTDAKDLLTAYAKRGEQARAAEQMVLERLGPSKGGRFLKLAEHARRGGRTRENLKNEGVRALVAMRKALLKLGDAMTHRGVLTVSDDIFFLTWEELPAVRDGSLEAAPLVAKRRAEYESNCRVTPPSVVIGDWDGRGAQDLPSDAMQLTGLAVASGLARGPARVIRTLRSDERVLPGEVLVAPFTDPGWTPYFVPAAAIVVDLGGMLSHGSIIAREYGIPAVVNVTVGTSAIKTGDIVEVDGNRGVVTVVERRPDA
ncbi:MAG: hypothetical protein EG823_02770 [Actinobacteria bacterium]|nr:hypothetical protein [Actinomycetota bacterium]